MFDIAANGGSLHHSGRGRRGRSRTKESVLMETAPFKIGFLLFPGMTQLDMTGPYEVLARLPGTVIHLVWKEIAPVRSDRGLAILATDDFATCPGLDLLCVP